MCFDPSALPPDPVRSGALEGSERLVLTAADGSPFAATLARTRAPDAPGMVILPDVRGLHPYYERLAEHVADAGIHALAVDLYGRTAGAEHRDEGFDYAPHRAAARDEQVDLDTRAGVARLRELGAGPVVAMGFCFGGRAALMQASGDAVDGVIGFYGWPARQPEGSSSPMLEAQAGRVRVPVLAIFGGADEGIGPDQVQGYERALTDAGATHESVTYPGAPHGFFDKAMSEHAQACRDAWARVLAFVDGLSD
ncbi:MAG TPA: dienelactone hydrolase family protein [Actinomycetota bacterium]|nr:dienelactone hydrolase family protein [Actinomycetota bacterium]